MVRELKILSRRFIILFIYNILIDNRAEGTISIRRMTMMGWVSTIYFYFCHTKKNYSLALPQKIILLFNSLVRVLSFFTDKIYHDIAVSYTRHEPTPTYECII